MLHEEAERTKSITNYPKNPVSSTTSNYSIKQVNRKSTTTKFQKQ